MKLHLVHVDATTATSLRCGDRVSRGQELGIDTKSAVRSLAPADGVIRHIGLGEDNGSRIIHIISKDD